ncbi:MAG: MFS transporter [Actinobacteria bacterium]|nr:MFS transporter [Actinomycetota bacterium]
MSVALEEPRTRRKSLKALTGGASLVPLAVLFSLNFVDEFDRVAFAALAPEIRDAFNLSDEGISTLRAIASVLALFAALPIGILADRFNRVRISIVAGVAWGIAAVLTGVVPALILLYVVRFFSGVGRISNEAVHPSLLADYYPRKAHPRIFGIHRMANATAPVAGVIAGYVGATWGWQTAFFVLAAPTAVTLAIAARLREPARGESIDAELAIAQAGEKAVPFAEARRQLFAVPTLRRLWIGAFFFGLGTLQLDTLLSLFFEKVYGFDALGRGWVQFVFGAGTVAGLVAGSRFANRAVADGRRSRLPTVVGAATIPFFIGLLMLAASPIAAVGLLGAFLVSAGNGFYQPAYYTVVGTVAPPRVRSQSYAWAILIFGSGGLSYLLVFGAFGGEDGSYRGLAVALALITSIAGVAAASASKFFERDADQAAATLATAARLNEEREAGGSALLVCRGVDVAYDNVQVLFGVDLDVNEGEIVALLGTNGAGKSTLLKAISGLVEPIGGSIFFDGRDMTHADAVTAARAGIVQVPGGKAVFPTLTVAEHFRASTWLYADESKEAIDARVAKVLDMFPRLSERWDQMAGDMSGGEQQQLALGMAFVANPKLLIIDELSLGLAPTVVEQLLGIVRAIHAEGCTVILVEQSVNIALTIAQRAYFMEKGEVRFSGPTADLLARGDILRSVFLEGAASGGSRSAGRPGAPAGVGGAPSGDRPPAPSERSDPHRQRRRLRDTPDPDPPVLEVIGLTKRFGGITAVDDVSFALRDGEILGLIGPNGAGKTTIFDLISGLLPADAGRIFFKGVDISDWSPDRRAALGLGRSFQDARIFPSLTVVENIAIGLERHLEVRDHLSSVLDLPAAQETEEDVAFTVDDLIELMNLGAYQDKFVSELSTGSRRIVDLACILAQDPQVLMLDEPSGGVAQKETEALGPLLLRIVERTGCSVLVIEHDMPLITTVSDQILALELGATIVLDTPERVVNDPRVISSYLGGDVDVINRSGALADANGAAPTPRRKRSSKKVATKKVATKKKAVPGKAGPRART